MHTYTPANSICDGPLTKINLLSIMCVLAVFSCAHAKREKSLMIFNWALLLVVFESRCSKHGSERVNSFLDSAQRPAVSATTTVHFETFASHKNV